MGGTEGQNAKELKMVDIRKNPLHHLEKQVPPSLSSEDYIPVQYEDYIPESMTIAAERIQIGKVLGSGAGGVVHEGIMDGSVHVAIKLVHSHFITLDKTAWWRECEVLCRVRHPNCVAFYGFSFDSTHFRFVQELCHGDLRGAIRNHPDIVSERATEIMLQIAAAVRHLHEELDILHRDIKPENVLLSHADVNIAAMRLADFGLSRASKSAMVTGGLGTVAYMAPELFKTNVNEGISLSQNGRYVDGMMCDVYSSGIMFAEVAQPRSLLYEGMSTVQILMAVVGGLRPSLAEGLPPAVSSLIQTMWDTNAKNRPTFSHIHDVLSAVYNMQSR